MEYSLIFTADASFFNHIMVREEQDIPNWILDEFGRFSLKSARTFFLEPGVLYGWGKFIWSSSIMPSKTLVLWKFFHGRLPIDQHIQNKGLHICSMCTLCKKHEKSIQHLFFECYNALHIWSWVRQIFLTDTFWVGRAVYHFNPTYASFACIFSTQFVSRVITRYDVINFAVVIRARS